jgi:kynurenine formamidase
MPVYPGTPSAALEMAASLKSEGYNELQIRISTHTGTHIDCPLHIIDDGFDTASSANYFVGRALKVNCTGLEPIPLSLFQQNEEVIRNVDFLLLFTGWDHNWNKPTYFGDFPVMKVESAEYLMKFKLKGIGIDAPSFDPVNSPNFPVHKCFLGRGLILIENLTNLQTLPENGFLFSCLPLKIANGDGSPVRAVAIID